MMMSDKAVRSYSHTSNRAKARAVIERKHNFKSVLENPFRIQWPSIPQNVQNMFLVALLASLENHVKRVTRKTARAAVNSGDSVEGTIPVPDTMIGSSEGANSVVENPALPFDFITIGINQVTRRLESQVKSFRNLVTLTTASSVNQISSELASIAVVLVCRADVDPPMLLDHIPHLVAGCNSTRPRSDLEGARQPLKLILLPKGSESAIAQALGIRRAAVIAIHNNAPYLPTFYEMLQSVPIISAPWLVPPVQHPSPRPLIPTHIKQLRTSAPKDMKAAKEQRAKARAAAKRSSTRPMPKKRVVLTTAGLDP